MSRNQWKVATGNDPNIIVTLVGRNFRTHAVWADPHNEPFYLPPWSQATHGRPREVINNPNNGSRQLTPDANDPKLLRATEPALQITFNRKPKNPELGYLLGSDRKLCDVFLGSADDCISERMFTMSFNQYNDVIMRSSPKNDVLVSYGKQQEKRRNFTWIFPSDQETIFVEAGPTIAFTVETPPHETDKESYEANCRNFMKPANIANEALKLLNPSSRPGIELTSRAMIARAPAERPFYIRTVKLGDGGFGKVYRARCMPNGRTVAVKRFKSKKAWRLEADVLQRIARTPHENTVEFIDLGLGKKPYLVMGLAPGGNLEEQHKYMPFNNREIALILYQMLNALDFLHDECNMMHRDVKSVNILCDSRAHYRLADFGVAKEGEILKSHKGTKPWMAPEMFGNKPYTALVDVWALGLVIARFMANGFPPGFRGDEGFSWCEAVVAHFQGYDKRCRAEGARELEHIGLTIVVGDHMLRMDPEERESASGCLVQGDLMCWNLASISDDISNTLPREDTTGSFPSTAGLNRVYRRSKQSGVSDEHESSEENATSDEQSGISEEELGSQEEDENEPPGGDDFSEDNDSEAETEVPEARPLDSDEWESLERAHPVKANSEDEGARHYMYTSFVDQPEDMPERVTTADSDEDSESQRSRRTEVQERSLKRKRSPLSNAEDERTAAQQELEGQSDAEVAAAPQSEEGQSQHEEEPSLDDYYRPGQPGHLINPVNQAFNGAGETLDLWIAGRGSWPGQ